MKYIKEFEKYEVDDLKLKIGLNDLKEFFVCENSGVITIFKYIDTDQYNKLSVYRLYIYEKDGVIEKENRHFTVDFRGGFMNYIIYTSDDLKDCLDFVDYITNITKYNL